MILKDLTSRLRKPIARLLIASLLFGQQGLFVSEAAAQVLSGNPGGAAAGAGAGAAAAGVSGRLPTVAPFSLSLTQASPLVSPMSAPSLIAEQAQAQALQALAPALIPALVPARAEPARPSAETRRAGSNHAPAAGRASKDADRAAETVKAVSPDVRFDGEAAKASYDAPIDYPVVYPSDAPGSFAEVTLKPAPGSRYTPSPEDWSDQTIYFPLIDRFAVGEGAMPEGDPRNGRARHGGNLKGLIAKLDYIKAAGFTTLMINPVFVNAPDGYHGYSPLHLMGIDPHIGTMDDFKLLVKELHKRDMYLIFDLAINHAGSVFDYKGSAEWDGMEGAPKEIGKWNYPFFPSELKKPENFSRRGVLNNWEDEAQKTNADFPPYQRRFDTSNPATQELLINAAKWWIKEGDVDSFRLDAYKHIYPEFWPRFHREIGEYAASLGKKNFFRPGEILTNSNDEIARAMGPDGMNGAYNYPAYLNDLSALLGKGPTRLLEKSIVANVKTLGAATLKMIRFLDTQDTFRFLDETTPRAVLWVALSYIMFSMGIPLVYYGGEQAFRQPHVGHYDPRNREDMFAEGQYKSSSSEGDQFDQNSPTYKYLAKLASLRRELPALRRGEQHVRWSEKDGPGIYAFSRIYEGQEVLVVMNTSGEAAAAAMFVDADISAPGTSFSDAMDPAYAAETYVPEGGGSKIAVDVPAHGVRVLVRR